MKRKRIVRYRRIRNRKKIPFWLLWAVGLIGAAIYTYVFYFFFVGPFSYRWKAFYGEIAHPRGYSIQGIDISHYQGDIDWKKLKKSNIEGSPVEFVIIKATEGNTLIDPYFNENFSQAKEYNFIRGAYHFFVPSVPADEQARHFLSCVKLESGDFPPVLDIEHIGNLSRTQVRSEVLTWLRIVETHYQVKPILYTNYKFKLEYLNDSIFDSYPYWIAHYYVDTIRYKGKWKLWQHTDCGKVDGIKGFVDFDIYNGSMYDLRRFIIQPPKN